MKSDYLRKKCTECNGAGSIDIQKYTPKGTIVKMKAYCTKCLGEGIIKDEEDKRL